MVGWPAGRVWAVNLDAVLTHLRVLHAGLDPGDWARLADQLNPILVPHGYTLAAWVIEPDSADLRTVFELELGELAPIVRAWRVEYEASRLGLDAGDLITTIRS